MKAVVEYAEKAAKLQEKVRELADEASAGGAPAVGDILRNGARELHAVHEYRREEAPSR